MYARKIGRLVLVSGKYVAERLLSKYGETDALRSSFCCNIITCIKIHTVKKLLERLIPKKGSRGDSFGLGFSGPSFEFIFVLCMIGSLANILLLMKFLTKGSG